jgi:chromosome segregation ATPase
MRAESIENDLRKEHLIKVNELTKKLSSVELQLAEERKASTQSEINSKQAHEELTAEVEVIKSELSRITREKEVLHEKVRDLEAKLEGEKRQVVSIRRESDTIMKNLQGTIKELKYKASDLQDKNSHSIKIEQELKDNLRAAHEKLSASEAESHRKIESLEKERQKDLDDAARVYMEKIKELKENFKGELEKQKKRGDSYKKELEEMRKRGKILSNAALAAAASSYGGLPATGPSNEEFMALAATLPTR